MKVYLVYWCNNEHWEDYNESVDAVFSTRECAEQFILAQGYISHVCESEWEKQHMADRFDSIDDDGYGLHSSMWVREMEVVGGIGLLQCEEIVRCCDCKHSYLFDMSWKLPKTNDIRYCGHGTYCQYEVPDDGFCAWGERNSE